jgi:hypothetical protein
MSFMGTRQFGGIMPRVDASELPLVAARRAINVDLTGGNLKTLDFATPFYALNDGTNLLDHIPSGEVASVTAGTKPTVSTTRMIQTLGLTIVADFWVSFLNPDTQEWVSTNFSQAVSFSTQYTEYGLQIYASVPAVWFLQKPGIRYEFVGPLFQFRFTSSNNGPDSTLRFPVDAAISPENSQFPQCFMPYSRDNVVFGHFQVVRCDHPSAPEEFYDPDISDPSGVIQTVPANGQPTTATFQVDMNYAIGSRQFFYYCQANVDASDREGPPSDISSVLVVPPGEMARIGVGAPASHKYRLYRSVDGSSGFQVLHEATSTGTTITDDFHKPLGDPLPVFGNPPTFSKGNLLHPGQFGVGFTGKEVWLSDTFRLHAWPEEWKVVFDTNIAAIQLIGSSIIVFTAGSTGTNGKVYMLTGSDPRYMGKYEIVTTAPLLNKLSICKIGQALFYVSNDGLMAVGTDGAQNITEKHYSRLQWLALGPAHYKAEVSDNSIFLTHANGGQNLRVDMNEGIARVSVWTSKQSAAAVWQSRLYSYPVPTRFTCARVGSTIYPLAMILHDEDAGRDYICEITSGKSARIPRTGKSRHWSFSIELPAGEIVDQVAVASATEELAMVERVGND